MSISEYGGIILFKLIHSAVTLEKVLIVGLNNHEEFHR